MTIKTPTDCGAINLCCLWEHILRYKIKYDIVTYLFKVMNKIKSIGVSLGLWLGAFIFLSNYIDDPDMNIVHWLYVALFVFSFFVLIFPFVWSMHRYLECLKSKVSWYEHLLIWGISFMSGILTFGVLNDQSNENVPPIYRKAVVRSVYLEEEVKSGKLSHPRQLVVKAEVLQNNHLEGSTFSPSTAIHKNDTLFVAYRRGRLGKFFRDGQFFAYN